MKKEELPEASVSGYNPIQVLEDEYRNYKGHTNVVIREQLAEIHKKNLKKLAQMSEEEILKEKKNLEENLNPRIIQFLKSKSKKSCKRQFNQDSTIQHDILPTNEPKMNINVSIDKDIKLSPNDNDKMKIGKLIFYS